MQTVDNLYVLHHEDGSAYYYSLNGNYYIASMLLKMHDFEENIDELERVDPFNIDPNGSKILVVDIDGQGEFLFQRLSNLVFVELAPHDSPRTGRGIISDIEELNVPSSQPTTRTNLTALPLSEVGDAVYLLGGQGIEISKDELLDELNSITISGVKARIIPFNSLRQIGIVDYVVDPGLQEMSGHSDYSIITIKGGDNRIYLVKARYDPVTRQIFP